MIPFYITSYNSPDLLRRLLGQMDDLLYSGEYQFIISDQSNDKHSEIYKAICDKRGLQYLHYPNKGATQAKKSVLAHALSCDFEFCHQISEDFIRTSDSTLSGPVKSGSSTFDRDALTLLRADPTLAVVKWNVVTSSEGDMGYLYRNPEGTRHFNVRPDMTLPYITGSVCYSNWAGTWNVKGVEEIRLKSVLWTPSNDFHRDRNEESGGEWAVSMSSFGKAACLVAQPFIHPERVKPVDSKP